METLTAERMPAPAPGLRGRCAIITGSTGGLGLDIAQALAAEGCGVVLCGLAAPDEIVPTLSALRAQGGQAEYRRTDVTRPEEVEALVAGAAAAFGSVDILVNNAVVRHAAPVQEFPINRWTAALDVNVTGAFLAIRSAMPHMIRNGYGTIVNVSSVHGLFGTVNRIDYVTTKTALIGMTKAVALEARSLDITCNAICPGSVLTPHSNAGIERLMAMHGLTRAAAEQRFLRGRGHARFVSGAKIGAFIAFLAKPAGRDINGAVVPIDAGYSAGNGADLGAGGDAA